MIYWIAAVIVILGYHLWRKRDKRALVLVLGDLGRSPRMQYHVVSLAEAGYLVDLMGDPGSPLPESIQRHKRVSIVYLSPASKISANLPRFLYVFWALVRIMSQFLQLFYKAFRLPSPTLILCQV